jgi:hypothetical protein
MEMQNQIEQLLTDSNFPWYLSSTPNNYTVDPESHNSLKSNNLKIKDHIQLVHTVIVDGEIKSPYFSIINSLFEQLVNNARIEIAGFYRIKCNLQPQKTHNTEFYNTPHIDNDQAHKVAIYYVNDSDGDTTFFKESNNEYKIIKTVEPKKGRFVVFDGKYYHAGRHPNDHDTRLVINFNFI